ncbi:MAG: BsuPI-related putative proteinase inhibitor [Acidimicrobiia bacterium]
MRSSVLLAAVALMSAACGDGGGVNGSDGGASDGGAAGGGVALVVAYEPDPPVTGAAVTWSLAVRNDGAEAVTLTFPSGKRGDVVLEDERRQEVYRWSRDRFFTEAVHREQLRPGQEVVYRLEEPSLPVGPGEYDLVATLAAEPEVGPDRQRLRI